jgi:hypothetical protein
MIMEAHVRLVACTQSSILSLPVGCAPKEAMHMQIYICIRGQRPSQQCRSPALLRGHLCDQRR